MGSTATGLAAGSTLALAGAPVGLGSLVVAGGITGFGGGATVVAAAGRTKENFEEFRLGLSRAPYMNSTLRWVRNPDFSELIRMYRYFLFHVVCG